MELQQSMKMNIMTMTKKEIGVLVFAFAAAFFSAVIIGAMGPPVFDVFQTTADDQGVDMHQNTSQFVWELKNLGPLQQALIFSFNAIPSNPSSGHDAAILVSTSLWGSTDTVNYRTYADSRVFSRTIECIRNKKLCEPEVLVYDQSIRWMSYRFGVTFLNTYTGFDWFSDVRFSMTVYNRDYTTFSLWFRLAFYICSAFASTMYLIRLRKFHFADWSYEQKWVGLLLLVLMGYNNPVAALQILIDGPLFVLVDILFFINFVAVLMLFWLCIFDGVLKPSISRTFKGFYLPKIALIGAMWFATLVVLAWLAFHDYSDPRAGTPNELPGFVFFKVMQLVLLITYAFWLLFAVIRAIAERQSMPQLTQRIALLSLLSLLVVVITVLGVLVNALDTEAANAAQFLSFYALYNIYVWALAIAFAPSSDAMQHATSGGVHTLPRVDDPEGSADEAGGARGGASGAKPFGNDATMMRDLERSAGSDDDFAAERERRRRREAGDDDILPMSAVSAGRPAIATAEAPVAAHTASAPVSSHSHADNAAPAAQAQAAHEDAHEPTNPFAAPAVATPAATTTAPFPVLL